MSHNRNDTNLFLSAINQSIGEWTELKHVIEVYGAGGHNAFEKLTWMSGVLLDYFRLTPMDQLKYEIHDYIETIVDNEFDFVPMDRSLDIFITKLLEYHSLWSNGESDKIRSIMEERRKVNEVKREAVAKETSAIDDSLRKMALSPENSNPVSFNEGNAPSETGLSADVGGSNSAVNDDSSEWMVVSNKRKSNRKR